MVQFCAAEAEIFRFFVSSMGQAVKPANHTLPMQLNILFCLLNAHLLYTQHSKFKKQVFLLKVPSICVVLIISSALEKDF